MKQKLELLISLCVSAWDVTADAFCNLLGIQRAPRCIILAYHSVTPRERALFAAQMDIVAKTVQVVPADVRSLPERGKRYAAITFDDGLENILENALPELRIRNLHSTLFIVTDGLGQDRSWEHMGGEDTRQMRVMTEEQLRALPTDLVAIGSHTMTHPHLVSVDRAKIHEELAGSRRKLEQMLQRPITTFSFPYGAFNREVIEVSREAGYHRIFSALPIFGIAKTNEFVTGRVGVSPAESPLEFRLKLAGAYRWLPYAFALKRSLLSAVRGRAAKRTFELEVGENTVS